MCVCVCVEPALTVFLLCSREQIYEVSMLQILPWLALVSLFSPWYAFSQQTCELRGPKCCVVFDPPLHLVADRSTNLTMFAPATCGQDQMLPLLLYFRGRTMFHVRVRMEHPYYYGHIPAGLVRPGDYTVHLHFQGDTARPATPLRVLATGIAEPIQTRPCNERDLGGPGTRPLHLHNASSL